MVMYPSSNSVQPSSHCCLRRLMLVKYTTTDPSVWCTVLPSWSRNSWPTVNQSAFVKGRSIQDNFCLCNKWKDRSTQYLGRFCWRFCHLGFGRKWCNLLCLLSISSTRLLVNGEPGPIMHHRGLRHGDPLSPMLFL
ncbi:hypothetical protein U9M48_035987 [Paspalum notatum var. saurae]|uniref:Uncharacterized protein n=1 Tax=Paspalum notatum var. saurae TaxID=547442 RepID=A0AAQ3X8E1_PASNO